MINRILLTVLLGALSAPATPIALVMGDPGTFTANWTADSGADEFWDNPSWDEQSALNGCNIGHYIDGTLVPGTCYWFSGNLGPGRSLEYWASAANPDAAPGEMWFRGGPSALTLGVELAMLNTANELWAYYRDGSEPPVRLFSGPDNGGTTVQFDPQGRDFGFYLVSGSGSVFHTESSRNVVDAGLQHFVVFRETPAGAPDNSLTTYWIGVEDLTLAQGDRDYNDLIVRVEQAPEPATLVLVGLALLLGASLGRRFTVRRALPATAPPAKPAPRGR